MTNLDTLLNSSFQWNNAWHMIHGYWSLLGELKMILLSLFGILESPIPYASWIDIYTPSTLSFKHLPTPWSAPLGSSHSSEQAHQNIRITRRENRTCVSYSQNLSEVCADYTCSLYKLRLKFVQTSAEVSKKYYVLTNLSTRNHQNKYVYSLK